MRSVLNGIGMMLHVPAGMALISILIVVVFGEYFALMPFFWTALSGFALGQLLYHTTRKKHMEFGLLQMMWIVSLGWLLCSVLAAFPFFLSAQNMDGAELESFKMGPFREWINSHFEALSGITTTGLTMTGFESEIPRSLQWWRSFLQWIGGVGIVVFASNFYVRFRPISDYYEESVSKDEMLPDVEVKWYKIWWVYLILTVFCVLLLWVQKLPFWEALNHGMTAISTGGFSITGDSAAGYSNGLKASVIFIIILGALNFNLYHLLFAKGDWKRFLKNQQHMFLIAFIAGGAVFLFLENNFWNGTDSSWLEVIFHMASAATTTGFSTTSLENWPDAALLVLTVAMLIGGSTASTAGGLKILRLLLLIKGNIYNTLQWAFKREKKLRYDWHGRTFSHEGSLKLYRSVGTFHFFWILFYVLTLFILMHNVPGEYRLSEIVFENASAMGTTGLSTGITGHTLNNVAKLDLMAAMLVGRLELVPFVVLFTSILKFQKEKRLI